MAEAAVVREWRAPFPLDVRLTLSVHGRGRSDPTFRVDRAGAVWRTSLTPEGPGTIRVAATNPKPFQPDTSAAAMHMGLRTEEVPIRFLKDREGRLSHHKRSGWFSPWQAAWINLRAMFVYGANFFLFKPGLLLLALGLLLTLPLSFGQVTVGPITFSLHWMLLGLSLATLGLQCVYMGILSQVFFDYDGRATARWFRRFPYNRMIAVSALLFGAGVALGGLLTANYLRNGFRLHAGSTVNNLGVTGMLFAVFGFMTFTFTLLLHSTAVAVRRGRGS